MMRINFEATPETLALEDHPYLNISLEDEMIVVDEAMQSANAIDDHLEETDRLLDITDSLEDLSVITSSIQGEPTPAEVAFIENNLAMGTAGTGVDPDTMVPAMESFREGKIALEGVVTSIVNTAKKIWETILKYLRQVWDHVENFFAKIIAGIPRLEKRIEKMEKDIKTLKSENPKKPGEKLEINWGTQYLCQNHKAAGSFKDLENQLESLWQACLFTYGTYAECVKVRGLAVKQALEKFDPKKPEETEKLALELGEKLVASGFDKLNLPGATKATGTHWVNPQSPLWDDYTLHITGESLPGNKSLMINYSTFKTTFYPNAKHLDIRRKNPWYVLEQIRKSDCELVTTTSNTAQEIKVSMPVLEPKMMLSNLDYLKRLLSCLNGYRFGPHYRQLIQIREDLKAAGAKASRSFTGLEQIANAATDNHLKGQHGYRVLQNFNISFANWASKPAIPLFYHSLSVVRAHLSLLQKCLNMYESETVDQTAGAYTPATPHAA